VAARLTRATIAVLAGAFLLAAFTAWWYTSHRRGFPLHIDESGYTGYALDHLRALQHDGVRGLIESFEDRSVNAPLVPLLTVPALLVLGEGVGPGFAIVAGFYALLIVASYAVARRLLDPWPSALVALLVATTPQVVRFSRMYYFAVPAAALFMVAIWCFLRSDGLARPAWAICGGAALGLAVLTRTMVLSLVVGVLGAALIQAASQREAMWRRLLTLGAAAVVGVAVAATWYKENFANVWANLVGTRFRSPRGAEDPYDRLPGFRQLGQVIDAFQLPVAGLLVVVLVIAALLAWRRRGRPEGEAFDRAPSASARRLATNQLFLAVVIAEAAVVYAIADEALGQWIMVLPLIVTLVVFALTSVRRPLQLALAGLLVLVAAFNLALTSGVVPRLSDPRVLDGGPFGPLPLTDGRDDIQQRLAPIGDTGRPGHLSEPFRRWREMHIDLTSWMLRYAAEHGQRPVVFVVGGESRLLNVNDLLLSDRLLEENGLLVGGRVFHLPNRQQFDDPRFGLPNFAVTFLAARQMSHSAPLTPAEEKIQSFGFGVVRTVQLPDRPARIWWRSQVDVVAAHRAT
jgi:4-amino-4-deoxy-L-arabinose transferase-like glycosyltransferase